MLFYQTIRYFLQFFHINVSGETGFSGIQWLTTGQTATTTYNTAREGRTDIRQATHLPLSTAFTIRIRDVCRKAWHGSRENKRKADVTAFCESLLQSGVSRCDTMTAHEVSGLLHSNWLVNSRSFYLQITTITSP